MSDDEFALASPTKPSFQAFSSPTSGGGGGSQKRSHDAMSVPESKPIRIVLVPRFLEEIGIFKPAMIVIGLHMWNFGGPRAKWNKDPETENQLLLLENMSDNQKALFNEHAFGRKVSGGGGGSLRAGGQAKSAVYFADVPCSPFEVGQYYDKLASIVGRLPTPTDKGGRELNYTLRIDMSREEVVADARSNQDNYNVRYTVNDEKPPTFRFMEAHAIVPALAHLDDTQIESGKNSKGKTVHIVTVDEGNPLEKEDEFDTEAFLEPIKRAAETLGVYLVRAT